MPGWITPVAVWPGLLLLLAFWAWAHRRKGDDAPGSTPTTFLGRVAIAFAVLLFAAQAAQSFVVFATNWPLWPILLAGAALVEVVLSLYQLERRALPRRTGAALSALRALLILAVVAMLCQPVRIFDRSRQVNRRAVLLLDTSSSMQVADNGMTPAEKVRLAERLSPASARRPFALDEMAARLREAQQRITSQGDWLMALSTTPPGARPELTPRRVEPFRRAIRDILKPLEEDAESLGGLLSSPLLQSRPADRGSLEEIRAKLVSEVRAPLEEAARMAARLTEQGGTNFEVHARTALDAIRRAAAAVSELEPKLTVLGESLDETVYRSLPAAAQKEMDAAAALTRQDLALRLLTQKGSGGRGGEADKPSLLDRLEGRYGLGVYTFAEEPVRMTASRLRAPFVETNRQEAAGARVVRNTDIAAALEKAMADAPAEQLAGIVLLTDGRHNTPDAVEPVARKLGLQQTPIYPVVFGGGRRPPTDAAIVSVEAPDNVYTNDKVYINADLKLDGLSGTNVSVCLWDGDSIVSTNGVNVIEDSFRKRLQLTDVPQTNGLHVYRVAVQTLPGEVNTNNNSRLVPIFVSGDQTKLLLIEGRPRWEFRYLKNLFVSRDTSVRLQYVMLHPDRVAEMPPRADRSASVSGSAEDAEATALPRSEAEWMNFDVVILGDVAPAEIGDANLEILRKYVAERGGTLIVLSGPFYMPHAFTGTPLDAMLPVVVEPSERPVLAGPEPEFRIALTDEGRESVLMRLADDPQRNIEAWAAIPAIYWRHVIRTAKEGASVLAYAVEEISTGAVWAADSLEVPDEESLNRQRKRERENALVVVHHVAAGRVLFLSFDHTWRLRYRRGDLFHHRFWGQILRWATADKLPTGTSQVRVGTDRPRYAVGATVRVKARLFREDFTAITRASPEVAVWSGDRKVMGRRMQYLDDSAGVYAADLGVMPEGRYRIELSTRDIEGLPSANGAPVSSEFVVTADESPEETELAADRGLLTRVAGLSGGKLFEPGEMERVLEKLGPPTVTVRDRRQTDLWNSWPLFLLMLAVAGAEWGLRKKARLP